VDKSNEDIHSYLPFMQRYRSSFSKEDLIAEVRMENIPSAWVKDFKLAKLHLQTRIKDIMGDLVVIGEKNKINPKPTHNYANGNKKQLKNTCRIHNSNHEWAECHQNPKNNTNRQRQGNEINGKSCKEHRRTARKGWQSSREQNQD
jgi:hypothetical protein